MKTDISNITASIQHYLEDLVKQYDRKKIEHLRMGI